jgi:phosphatidylserine decarboxylase
MSNLSLGERVMRSAWRLTPQRALSDVIGWSAQRSLPPVLRTALLRRFARQYGIDVAEAEKPLEAYSGLQEFFTRRLRPGARPIDTDPSSIVSPADGVVVEIGRVERGRLIDAKDAGFTLAELLADEAAAEAFEGGTYQVTYLSPRDYHRVHAPFGGRVLRWHYVPGCLFPVNERSVAREPGLFSKNERFVTLMEGEGVGLFAVVMVAAVGVGHITASYDPEVATHSEGFCDGRVRHKDVSGAVRLAKGDELGIFNLGSTTIVVFPAGRAELLEAPRTAAVRMGQPIGRLRPAG